MNLTDAYGLFYTRSILLRKWRMVIELKGETPFAGFGPTVIRKLTELCDDMDPIFNTIPDGGAMNDETIMHYGIKMENHDIMTLHDLVHCREGDLLLAAIGLITSTIRRNSSPDDVLQELRDLAEVMYRVPPDEPIGGEENDERSEQEGR